MTRTLIVSIILSGLIAVGVKAQDPGIVDTVELIVTLSPDAQANQLKVQLEVWVFNDEELFAANMGFSWDNSNLTLDSAVASALTDGGFQIGPFFYEDNSIALTNANQRALFGGIAISPLFSADSSGRRLWASYYFTLSSWNESDQINIDTLEFNDASKFQLVRGDQTPFVPVWVGGLTIIDPNAPADIVLSKDSLRFSSIEGAANPVFQEFDISSSSGEIIDFSLSESAPWLIVTPSSGNTPRTIRVEINNIGLSTGNYAETIIVNSAAAANTPLEVEITLEVVPPPPVIGLDPGIFFFSAVAGEANPDSKTLTITNTGGSTLNWSATNSQAWLNLNPVSGGDSNDVTVSIDITGLPFGEYADTIIVSDPEATNSPLKVPVNLSVASDLPIIVVDPPSVFVIIEPGGSPFDSAFFYVRNGGGGTMNFWIENGGSPRIIFIEPDTSVAPDLIKVSLKLGGESGDEFHDTVWVYSDQAINSPVPVEIIMHLTDNPGQLRIFPDTIEYSMFECSHGLTGISPVIPFNVFNLGGDDPLDFEIVYESDFFSIFPLSGTADQVINLFAEQTDLPLGTYVDTVLIYARKSVVSPETLIVNFDIVPGSATPKIFLMDSVFVMTAQEDQGPIIPRYFEIRNRFGGCMEWSIDNSVPWASVTDSSGNVPELVGINATAFGLTIGEYVDSFYIIAPAASNSPRKIELIMKVWRLHGDNNYDNIVNILDLTYLVDFIFRNSGLSPQPELFVGDVNCDSKVNIVDLTYLVDYFFRKGPPPCGNPVK
ncbi:MAG: hypothetical protein IIC66_05975 [candidate division Zixibacteria bacterium]|nr:hypothetical protein [candidate division Zixibacteria bacterium]